MPVLPVQPSADARRRALWGFGLMVGGSLGTVAAAALASVLACSPRAAVHPGVVAASPAPGILVEGPPPPSGGLPMPSLDLDWRPPSAVAGDIGALATALAAHPRVGLAVDAELDGGAAKLDAMRLAALVGRLAPNSAVHPIPGQPRLAEILLEDPPLSPSLGETGRTRWAVPEHLAVDVERVHAWAELGDPAVLVIGSVGVDAPVWRQLSTAAVGTCAPVLDALLEGQSQSLALLEPFLDHADALLEAAYLDELARVVPELSAELAEFEPERQRGDFDADGWARYQCGRRYLDYIRPFAGCVSGPSCASTPRLFLRGSARIGSVEPSVYVPDDCPRRLDRDVIEELRAPARAAAELAADHLDVGWMILAERLATLSEIHGALGQLCEATRRRFTPADIEALRGRLANLGSLYTTTEEPAHDARFLANDGDFHVPGLGRVRQLARYDGGTGSASRELIAAAGELESDARAKAQCVPRPGEPPLMVMLLATGTATAEFLGFFYPEELWCGELGPL